MRTDKYELARQMIAARDQRQRDAEIVDQVHQRDREIARLRIFLKEISAPLSMDVLGRGDFKEIAQILTGRVALAMNALNGDWPRRKNDETGICPAVLHVVDQEHPDADALEVSGNEADAATPEVRPDAEPEGETGEDGASVSTT